MDVVMSEGDAGSTAPDVIEEVDLAGDDSRLPTVEGRPATECYGERPPRDEESGGSGSKACPISSQPVMMTSHEVDDQKTPPAVSKNGEPSTEQAKLIAEHVQNMSGDYMTRQLAAYHLVMRGGGEDTIVMEEAAEEQTPSAAAEESRSGVANNVSIEAGSWSKAVSIAESMETIESREVVGTTRSLYVSEKAHAGSKTIAGPGVIDLSDDENEPKTSVQSKVRSPAAQDKRVSHCAPVRSQAGGKPVREKTNLVESPDKERVVVSLLDDSDDSEVMSSSAADKQRITELEAAVKKHNIKAKRMSEEIDELNEIVEELQEGNHLATKMVTLRRQHKTAIAAMKRENNESIARMRDTLAKKAEDIKDEYEIKKEQWKRQMNNSLAKKSAVIDKTRQSLEEAKQAARDKLEEAKREAAETRSQKTRNAAEAEALKKTMREELEEEKLSCRPEKNRLVQDREEQIKELKAQIRELEKTNAKAKADMITFRKGIQDEIEVTTGAKKTAEELHGKYIKYKTYAQRLHADLEAQETKHGNDKAELVTKHEQQQFKQEQKWSLQWNIAQQKSSEVISLSRLVSELGNAQVRRDALIAELRRKVENSERDAIRAGDGAARSGPVVIDEDVEEHMTTVSTLVVPSDRPDTRTPVADADDRAFATSHQQKCSKNQTPEPSALPGHLTNAPRKSLDTAAGTSTLSHRSASPGTLAYSRMPSASRAMTELPQSVPTLSERQNDVGVDVRMRPAHVSKGDGKPDKEPRVLGEKRKVAVTASDERAVKRTRMEDGHITDFKA